MQTRFIVDEAPEPDAVASRFQPQEQISKWESDRANRLSCGGFDVMSGGPRRQYLPEHQHPDVQLSVYFGKRNFTKVIAALEPHSGAWDDGERVVVFLLSPELLGETVDDLAYRGCADIRTQNCKDEVVEALAQAVLRELASASPLPGRRLYFESIGYALAGHVVRTYAHLDLREPFGEELAGNKLNDLAEFIDDSLGQPIGIADMAIRVGLPLRRFADSFKKTTGLTPYQFVVRRRIKYAKRLLRIGTLPIVDVALRTGFANQSHFTAVFTRLTGMTPSRWRTVERS